MLDSASSSSSSAKLEVEASPEFLLGYPQRVVLGVVQDDDYPPSLDKLVEIAQMTFRTAQRHVIYQILKRCLNSTNGKWRQIFKALQVVDYCLHVGTDEFLPWASYNRSLFSDLQSDERQQHHDTLHGIRLIEKQSNHILDILARQDELLPFEKRTPSAWMFRVTLSPNPYLDPTPLTPELFAKYSSLENAPRLVVPKDLAELGPVPTDGFEISPTPIAVHAHTRDLSEFLRSRHGRNGSSEPVRPKTAVDESRGSRARITRRPSMPADDASPGLQAKLPWPLGPLKNDIRQRGDSLPELERTNLPPIDSSPPRDLGLGISLSAVQLGGSGQREPWTLEDVVVAPPKGLGSETSSITPPASRSGLPSPAQRRESKRHRTSMRSQSLMDLKQNPHRQQNQLQRQQTDEPAVVDQARYINIGPLRKGSIARTRPTRSSSSLAQQASQPQQQAQPQSQSQLSQPSYTPTSHISQFMITTTKTAVESVSSVSDRSESVSTSREHKYASPARTTPATTSLSTSASTSGGRRTASDLVSDSKLETTFADDGASVSHTSYESSTATRQRRLRREHRWRRCWELGSGSHDHGRVWLEECPGDGEEQGEVRYRAVREVSRVCRGQRVNYDRELEAMAKFSHSKYVHCFVQSLGWYENTDTLFTAMEYLENGDLGKYLTRAFPETEVKLITTQLLEGLSYMHENGFIHGDLKPGNILVSEQGPCWWVKLSDFGISRKAETLATASRGIVGTRRYLAPELLGLFSPDDMDARDDYENDDEGGDDDDDAGERDGALTAAVDVWALGAIIYRLLTNESAFGRPRRLWRYVVRGMPFPGDLLSEAGVSGECKGFLEMLMAPAPGSRPTASQATLQAWLLKVDD